MAWIESHQELEMHQKTRKLARTLSLSIPSAIGTLHLLWWFTLEQAWRNGNLSMYDDASIESACRWQGNEGDLIKALQESGFLDGKKVHDWLDFAGRLVKDRIAYEKANGKRKKTVRKPAGNPTQPNLTLPNHIKETIGGQKTAPKNQTTKPLTDIQKLVKGWKLLKGIPTEGDESTRWDKVHFPRASRSAKALLDLFIDLREAVRCMEYVHDWLKGKKLDFTFETIIKHSDMYREVQSQRGQ